MPSSETTSDTFKKSSLDVKVVMACADNDIANIVLRFMCKQVFEKRFWPKDKEYICHTTGRSCVVKYLIDRWANPDKQLQYFSCSELAKPSPMCDVQCVASSSQDCEMNGASSSQDCEIIAVECGPGEGPVPVLDGSQPSERPCRRFRGKRKLNEEDVVKHPVRTKQPEPLNEPDSDSD